jgi:hypothetical protein
VLLFLDESYEKADGGGYRHAYAGFGVDEFRYRGLAAAVHQAKERYFIDGTSMTEEERKEARRCRILTSGPPEKAEVKATKLLTVKNARHHQEHGDAPGLLMAHSILDAVAQVDGTVFGVLSHPDDIRGLQQQAASLPLQFQRLLERVDLWMQEQRPREAAIIVLDEVSAGVDKHLSECMADFLYKSSAGRKMRHIVTHPFWVDSRTTAGSQVADIIAHLLMNSMRPAAEQKPLEDLWRKLCAREFRSHDGRTRGIRTIKRKQQAGA